MAYAKRFSVLGDKAFIKQNKFGVWQFRMKISSKKKVKKSKAIKPFPSIKNKKHAATNTAN